jgi:NAD(P)H-dependent FMN reductase
MKIVVVSGSSRPDNQSHKFSLWVETKLQALGADTYVVDLHTFHLPLDTNLDVATLNDTPEALKAWTPVRSKIVEADGFVFVSPEWNGMAPPALLNFILYASADEQKPLAHKPIQIMAVSATKFGGDYPVAELRAFGMKNAHGLYIPEHVVIRQCKTVFNTPDPDPANESDVYLQKRAVFGLKVLLQYAEALKPMRASSKTDLLAYPSGM